MIVEQQGDYEIQTTLGNGTAKVFEDVTLLIEGSWLMIFGSTPSKLLALIPSDRINQVVPVTKN